MLVNSVHRSPTVQGSQSSIIKKPPFAFCCTKASEGVGGAGGSRTLVQTSNVNAFYMFSFRLIFDAGLTGNGLTNAYLL